MQMYTVCGVNEASTELKGREIGSDSAGTLMKSLVVIQQHATILNGINLHKNIVCDWIAAANRDLLRNSIWQCIQELINNPELDLMICYSGAKEGSPPRKGWDLLQKEGSQYSAPFLRNKRGDECKLQLGWVVELYVCLAVITFLFCLLFRCQCWAHYYSV